MNMDYNFFADSQVSPFQLYNYNADLTGLPQDIDSTAAAGFPLDALGQSALLPSALGSPFDEPQSYDNSILNVHSNGQHSTDSLGMFPHGSIDSGIGLDLDTDMLQARRGSSEEKESSTPAQSRRKAQNRAAQRAFRERKERHVRDLEAKLNILTTTTSSLQSDNERLKMLLQKVQTENEALRASATTSPTARPFAYSDEQRRSAFSRSHESSSGSEQDASYSSPYTDLSGKTPPGQPQLLSASATWDFLQAHPKYISGGVDIGKVCERLKKLARCNGAGPMFDPEEVRKVIEEVDSNGADELL